VVAVAERERGGAGPRRRTGEPRERVVVERRAVIEARAVDVVDAGEREPVIASEVDVVDRRPRRISHRHLRREAEDVAAVARGDAVAELLADRVAGGVLLDE